MSENNNRIDDKYREMMAKLMQIEEYLNVRCLMAKLPPNIMASIENSKYSDFNKECVQFQKINLTSPTIDVPGNVPDILPDGPVKRKSDDLEAINNFGLDDLKVFNNRR
jgi:hypothetical protein